MPARSRHRPRLHSSSPPRAPPPPLEALHSGEARRAWDSDGDSDADSEVSLKAPKITRVIRLDCGAFSFVDSGSF
ncbi:sphingomyelin synthase-related protein 1 isoform X8 [Lutra lutra]|uniref:sphingomyelin synthase-related protein 1 isoform X8 n=1 Tax=Lutra lutra TaxID=9657 RepID=UPI001FD440AC|nr:sphingomyelin synthase-related protein 1 isoform X8 [Lutra lutra]